MTQLQDLRYAIRTLTRSPGFTAAAILTLALGIGSATAGFSLLNWVLLRPVPGVRDASRAGFVSFAARSERGFSPNWVTPTQRDGLLHSSPAVTGLAGIEEQSATAATDENGAKRLSVDFVTSDYFATVGARIQLGRGFLPEDDSPPQGRRVAVISDRLWHEFFSGRSEILGRPIRVNGIPFIVIGIAVAHFLGPDNFRPTDIWMPGATYWDVRHFSAQHRPPEMVYNRFVLRLQDGASFREAANQLQSAIRTLALADTTTFNPNVSASVLPGLGLEAQYGGKEAVDNQLALIIGVSVLVLLVACANVANLLLFRRAQRRADIVVRLVLGASRGRLVRYALMESTLVGFASGVLGVVFALWVNQLFHHFRLGFISMEGLRVDWRVLGFAVVAGILAAVVAGVIPALVSSRADLGHDLKVSGPTTAGGPPLLRSGLAVLQIAISLSLVSGTYLFARTMQRYAETPLGFTPAGVTIFRVEPDVQGYSPSQAQAYVRALRARIAALPGVEQVALVSLPPFLGITHNERIRRPDTPADARPLDVASQQVSGDYFTALRIPVLRGTLFRPNDLWPDSGRAVGKVILSARLAQTLFGTADPVGQLVVLPDYRTNSSAEVVAVAGDVHWTNRGGDVEPMLYMPVGQDRRPYGPMIAIRSHVPAGSLERQVQDIGKSLDPEMPIESNGLLSEMVARATSSQTLLFRLVGLLAALTLVLSAVGVYSLIAYGVTTRVREFGVRMALGAEARDILRTAARPAVAIISLGVIGGVGGAAYLTRFIKTLLYGVSPLDPLAFVTATVLIASAVLLASWFPARRAAKTDPMVALRYE